MEKLKLGEMEQRLADLIWKHEPMSSRELTEFCAAEFDWKRTTTYTMLKRLCERGMFENQAGQVSSLLSRDEFGAMQGEQFLSESFGGSLPRFLAAFTSRNRLSEREVNDILKLIDEYKE